MARQITLIKMGNGSFMPAYESDREKAAKVKTGDPIEVSYKQPRNYSYHKKYFALLQLTLENQDNISNLDHLRKVVAIRSGFADEVETPDGVIFIAHSISFGKMDEIAFKELFKASLHTCCELTGASAKDIEQELINFM